MVGVTVGGNISGGYQYSLPTICAHAKINSTSVFKPSTWHTSCCWIAMQTWMGLHASMSTMKTTTTLKTFPRQHVQMKRHYRIHWQSMMLCWGKRMRTFAKWQWSSIMNISGRDQSGSNRVILWSYLQLSLQCLSLQCLHWVCSGGKGSPDSVNKNFVTIGIPHLPPKFWTKKENKDIVIMEVLMVNMGCTHSEQIPFQWTTWVPTTWIGVETN